MIAEQETFIAQLSDLDKLIPDLHDSIPDLPEARVFSDSTFASVQNYLNQVKKLSGLRVSYFHKEKNNKENALIDRMGVDAYSKFKNSYENTSLRDLVLNRNVPEKIVHSEGRLIRKYQPAFMKPTSRFGRAQLYAPTKQMGNLEIDTKWFNVIVIWINVIAFYLALRWDLLRKLITFSGNLRLNRKQSA
jgi:hypothetical protein